MHLLCQLCWATFRFRRVAGWFSSPLSGAICRARIRSALITGESVNSRTISRLASLVTIAAVATASVLVASPGLAADVPAPTAVAASFSLAKTLEAGDITRSEAIDTAQGRLYFTIDRGTAAPGAIGWIDTDTNTVSDTTIELDDTEPAELAINAGEHELYVLHYRNGQLTVIDTETQKVKKVISGLPELAGTMQVDSDSGEVYVVDSGVTTVDPKAGSVSSEVAITTERYPLVKDAVYDSKNRMLWIAEGRAGVITGYNTVTNSWMSSIAAPISKFQYNNVTMGGRPTNLAVDESLGYLYVGVAPALADAWDNTQLVVLDTATMLHLGSPIDLGDTTRQIAVNKLTHEVYAANGFSNTFSVVNPTSWTVSNTIDFTAEGVTEGTGTAEANVWALATDDTGTNTYVSHPYGTSRISVITRAGDFGAVTRLGVTPGQEVTVPETPASTPWTGPEQEALGALPAGAVSTAGNTVRWSVSNYAEEWEHDLYGAVTTNTAKEFVFGAGNGWTNPTTGATRVTWGDGFRYRPYPGLAPDVQITYGNPVLALDSAGAGTLSFDVSWGVSDTLKSDGFTRVTVATFSGGKPTVTDGASTQTWTPDYAGRSYTPPVSGATTYPDSFPREYIDYLDTAIRAWWYASGSSLDPTKIPNPLTLSYSMATTIPDPGNTPDPSDPADPTEPGNPDDVTVTLSLDSVAAGSSITVSAEGLGANELAAVWLHSTPVKLASVEAAANGRLSATVTIPADTTPGVHRVELRTAASGTVSARLVVTAASNTDLASTGANVALPLAAGLLVASLGAVLLIARRRRTADGA